MCVCVCVFTEYVCDVHVCVENVRFMCRYVSAEVCACVCVVSMRVWGMLSLCAGM